MYPENLRVGQRIKITVCQYTDRCGAAKNPYGMVFGKDNTGYIIEISGKWEYNNGVWYDGKRKISPDDNLYVKIENKKGNVLYATIVSS